MITPEDRERIAAYLPEDQRPVQELVLYQIAETVRDVNEGRHPKGSDRWRMGFVFVARRMGAVLQRLIDEAAEADALRAELEELRTKWADCQEDLDFLNALGAAGVDNWTGYDYARELMREWRAEREGS